MNIYSVSILCFSFGVLLIAVLVLVKRKDIISIRFALFSVSVCGWGFPSSAWFSQIYSPETGLMLLRIAHGFSVFIPITWLHFVFAFTGKKEPLKYFYSTNYAISALLLLLSPTPLFIKGVHPIMGFKYFTIAGPFYHIYTMSFFTYVPYAFYYLMSAYRSSKGYIREQLKFFIIGTIIGFSSGGTAFFPVYHIPFIFLGFSLMPLYPIFMGIALIRYGLFDVQQIADAFQREKLTTLGLLTASINHEIRNPLYAAQSVLQNFKEGIKKSPEEVTDKVLSQINRALDVINKLNRFAKPNQNTITSQASISEAIQSVLDLISYEFELGKIKINNQIQKGPPNIRADQRQLEEILFNLIVNACHAMPNGGELVIASEAKQSHTFQITIQDTGTGISPEQAKHLFEPFYTTKGEKGTGLGLYVTKQLVERNGGKISVSSKPNQGTLFTLEFKTA